MSQLEDLEAALKEAKAKFKAGEINEEEYERRKLSLNTAIKKQQYDNMSDDVKRLFKSVKYGKDKEVKEMLAFKPSLLKGAVDPSGNTLLHIAAREGHKKIVKELLRHAQWYDATAPNENGRTAAQLARNLNYIEIADYLDSKLPPADTDNSDTSLEENVIRERLNQASDALAKVQAEQKGMQAELEARMASLPTPSSAPSEAGADARGGGAAAPPAEDKERLLSEFETRRRDLEAQHKAEEARQERQLQNLLDMKRNKRADKDKARAAAAADGDGDGGQ